MTHKILVVEAVPSEWHVLGSILLTFRYVPIWALDSRQAIEDAEVHRPQAVLLDPDPPTGDGFAVLERLRMNDSLSEIPVIVVSGDSLQVTDMKVREYGAVALVRKPVAPSALLDALRRVLEPTASRPE